MRKPIVGMIALIASLVFGSVAQGSPTFAPEGCQAFNPGQPTCTFTATVDAQTPVSGASGSGSWIVSVKRPGERKPIVLKSDSPPGAVVEFAYKKGDKVTAKALTPGTIMTAGSVQP